MPVEGKSKTPLNGFSKRRRISQADRHAGDVVQITGAPAATLMS